jgi:hypothetical protein
MRPVPELQDDELAALVRLAVAAIVLGPAVTAAARPELGATVLSELLDRHPAAAPVSSPRPSVSAPPGGSTATPPGATTAPALQPSCGGSTPPLPLPLPSLPVPVPTPGLPLPPRPPLPTPHP